MNLTGTNIISTIVPGDTRDIFPTHIDIYGKGGYISVSGIADRDNLSIYKKSPGMIVYTINNKKFWSLESNLSGWIELPFTGDFPRINPESIFYTIRTVQNIISGIKNFKNYNDTKFYSHIISDSGIFNSLSVQGGNVITFYSNPYIIKSGVFSERADRASGFFNRPDRPRPTRPRPGLLSGKSLNGIFNLNIRSSGIFNGLLLKTGEDKPGEEGGEDDSQNKETNFFDGGNDFSAFDDFFEEDTDEDFEEDDNQIDDFFSPIEITLTGEFNGLGGNEGGRQGGGGGGTRFGIGGGGGGGTAAGGAITVPMLFLNNSAILRFKDHYNRKIRNISVVEKGSSRSTGLNLTWGPDPRYLYPGERYTAIIQILKGSGVFNQNSGIIDNNLRSFRTSGLYNITSPLSWSLDWNGRIEGYRPDSNISPWFGTGIETTIYPVSIRFYGTSSKESLNADEITGLLSGEYAFDPRQPSNSKKIFIPTGNYIYFAWPANSGFNNIDFFRTYQLYKKFNKQNSPDFIVDGYKFIVDEKDVYFEQTLVTGVKNSVNYIQDYYLFRNRWILNGSNPIEIEVKRKDENIG